jgi:pyruvate/2-oxoglutarate dehydrogenase complex dihydrolipoamide acyltransferase (E2) component
MPVSRLLPASRIWSSTKRTFPDDCWVLRAPPLNPNDDSVTLTRWLVADRATVAASAPIGEIETAKAMAELTAERGGTLAHAVAAEARIPIGAPLAYVAATAAAAEEMGRIAAETRASPPAACLAATPKAQSLASAHGVGARGATIQERDVARHLAEHGAVAAEFSDVPSPRLADRARQDLSLSRCRNRVCGALACRRAARPRGPRRRSAERRRNRARMRASGQACDARQA